MKHKKLCKEDAVARKLKGNSEVWRKKREEKCEEVKLGISKLAISGPAKAGWMEVAESCQKLGSSGRTKRSGKKAKAKGKGVKLVGGEDEVPNGGEGGSSVQEEKEDWNVKRDLCKEDTSLLEVE